MRGCLSTSFNPHPASRPDATLTHAHNRIAHTMVSILTRPPGRMQHPRQRRVHPAHLVSILTRPPGRMQPPRRAPGARSWPSFNPHPASRPDATSHPRLLCVIAESFNPHPASRPDATSDREALELTIVEFQSSPGLPAGCNPRRAA